VYQHPAALELNAAHNRQKAFRAVAYRRHFEVAQESGGRTGGVSLRARLAGSAIVLAALLAAVLL
jgi:hypothetical protein